MWGGEERGEGRRDVLGFGVGVGVGVVSRGGMGDGR